MVGQLLLFFCMLSMLFLARQSREIEHDERGFCLVGLVYCVGLVAGIFPYENAGKKGMNMSIAELKLFILLINSRQKSASDEAGKIRKLEFEVDQNSYDLGFEEGVSKAFSFINHVLNEIKAKPDVSTWEMP